MDNYKNAFTEVYTIIQELNEEELSKIPPEVVEVIKNNMNKEYKYELDEELELKEQPMLPETKAILFNLFRDYLASPEQKEKIIKMQNEARQKNEERKKKQYSSSVDFNKKEEKSSEFVENKALVKFEKKNIFKRILDIIRNGIRKNS